MRISATVDKAIEGPVGDATQIERRSDRAHGTGAIRDSAPDNRKGRSQTSAARSQLEGADWLSVAACSVTAAPLRSATPLAWLTTTAARGPSLSSTQMLVAYQGIPLDAFVEPSTGSRTAMSGLSAWRRPLSSDKTPRPAPNQDLTGSVIGGEIRAVLASVGSRRVPNRSSDRRAPRAPPRTVSKSTVTSSASSISVDITCGARRGVGARRMCWRRSSRAGRWLHSCPTWPSSTSPGT